MMYYEAALREKCPNAETRKKSVFGHFSRSTGLVQISKLQLEMNKGDTYNEIVSAKKVKLQ